MHIGVHGYSSSPAAVSYSWGQACVNLLDTLRCAGIWSTATNEYNMYIYICCCTFLPSQPFGFCSNGASDFSDRFVWHLKVGQINVAYDLYSRIRQAGTGEGNQTMMAACEPRFPDSVYMAVEVVQVSDLLKFRRAFPDQRTNSSVSNKSEWRVLIVYRHKFGQTKMAER